MAATGGRLLRELEELLERFGEEDVAGRKCALLEELETTRLSTADRVARLHEALCFLHAFPDDAAVRATVERMLAGFEERRDLRSQRAELADSGIAGTDVRFPFFAPTARWLAERWPDRLTIEWSQVTEKKRLMDRVYYLSLDCETPGLDNAKLSTRAWIERQKRADETDAGYLVRRMAALKGDPTVRDLLYDELELPLVLRAGGDAPSRTRARHSGGRVHWQTRPRRRPRPDLAKEVRRPPLSVRSVGRSEGRALCDLARAAMATRARDLDAFAGGDPDDVRLVDCGDGLEFAVIGSQLEWRMMLEGVYGWLTLQNRVPIGYVLTSALLGSSEIAFNVFDTYRGGDAAHVYGRVLATARALFGSDTFTIYPYQLGHGNQEGLASGAWWFYQKLGFRARDPEVLALMDAELARMRRDQKHRSSIATLKQLARKSVFLETGRRREHVIGTFPFDRVGLAVTDYLARRFGSGREGAERVCAADAARLLGARAWKRFPAGERKAWLKWSPLVLALPGVERWTRSERTALARVVRAKGGRRESDYVRLFDGHAKLKRALLRLAGA
jgi:hypothetical protein